MRALISSIVLLALTASSSPAQSLASAAKKEAERRKAVKSGKVYTNGDLEGDNSAPLPSPANQSPAAPATTAPPSTQVPAINVPVGKPEDGDTKDEAYWRKRMTSARSALERS